MKKKLTIFLTLFSWANCSAMSGGGAECFDQNFCGPGMGYVTAMPAGFIPTDPHEPITYQPFVPQQSSSSRRGMITTRTSEQHSDSRPPLFDDESSDEESADGDLSFDLCFMGDSDSVKPHNQEVPILWSNTEPNDKTSRPSSPAMPITSSPPPKLKHPRALPCTRQQEKQKTSERPMLLKNQSPECLPPIDTIYPCQQRAIRNALRFIRLRNEGSGEWSRTFKEDYPFEAAITYRSPRN